MALGRDPAVIQTGGTVVPVSNPSHILADGTAVPDRPHHTNILISIKYVLRRPADTGWSALNSG